MKILVTGGAGYIGSHTVVELLNSDYEVVVVDNLNNSCEESLRRVEEICGKKVTFYKEDVRNKEKLDEIFEKEKIDGVIHFAGLKAVGESCRIPLAYFDNNLIGVLHLLEVMEKHHVKNFIFSSTATVYGAPETVPITEDFPLTVTNPYARTKLITEDMLRDIYKADNTWNIALLRYFNPIGAHESGLIGEDPNGIPNNLLPYVAKVATGQLEKIHVFGNDYDTEDGTGVRDYIHVVDLAVGHLKALEKLKENPGLITYNLGTGKGYSVLEIIEHFEKACGKKLPYVIDGRRPGDVAEYYANPEKAYRELGWKADKNLDDMCQDTWRWQSMNPEGYR